MFSSYILGSPSLWYDKRYALKLEARYAEQHQDLKANVYLYVGAQEALRKGDRRYKPDGGHGGRQPGVGSGAGKQEVSGLETEIGGLERRGSSHRGATGFTQGLKYLLPVR